MKAPPFLKGRLLRNTENTLTKLKNLLLQNHWTNSTKLCTLHSWVEGIQFYSNKGPCPFPRGDNYKIVKIHWRNSKIFFSRTTGPISTTKLGTMHPWVKGIRVCSNEGPCPFPWGDYYEIANKHWWNSKIFFSRTTGPISTKLGIKHLWVKGIQACSN